MNRPGLFVPTFEQQAIVEAAREARDSLMVQAFAGCAKSSTLSLVARGIKPVPFIILVFNRQNKQDLIKLVPPWVQVMTLNGIGHKAWVAAIGRHCTPDERKLGKIITEQATEHGIKLGSTGWHQVLGLVIAAMTAGLVPDGHGWPTGLLPDSPEDWLELAQENWIEIDPDLLGFARQVLIRNIKLAFTGQISYDDQIYCSALLGGVYRPAPLLGVDESQDLSPLNHIQVARCARDRIIAVGDRYQSIYAWRGATHDSMDQIRALRPKWIDLTLSQSFRCPKSHVLRASGHAIGFQAAPTNRLGSIYDWTNRYQGSQKLCWSWYDVASLTDSGNGQITVLCRNTAPLIRLAFKLIRQKVGVQMMGREIGKGLAALARKIVPIDSTPKLICINLIMQYAEAKVSEARAANDIWKMDKIIDQTQCLLSVLSFDQIRTAGDMAGAIESLFSRESGLVTLSTGHRFKGREGPVILHLDPWRIPSPIALERAGCGDDQALVQELNLRYVIETRAQDTLILADLEDFR